VTAAVTATDLAAHTALTTTAHGGLVASSDARLSDARHGLVVASSATPAGPSNTTAATALFSASVTAAAGDVLRLTLAGDWLNFTGSAQTVQLAVSLGGVELMASDAESFNSGAQRREWRMDVEVLFPTAATQAASALFVMSAATADNWTLGTTNQLGPGFGSGSVVASTPVTLKVDATLGVADASCEMLCKMAVLQRLRAS
jgi:hypothetical protein